MLDLVQTLAIDCDTLKPVINLVKSVLGLIQFGIPIVLILMGTIDLGKAVMSSDDKEVKAAQGRLIKRCLYAVMIFFVAFLVNLIMGIVGESGVSGNEKSAESWTACWNMNDEDE